ncbi:MAG TPA: SDR family oxidoreductase [Victivallales bacterium]|nr:SDR family oxidoreductase [Victivallales bacterium]
MKDDMSLASYPSLKGKRALITGGAQGIGRGIACKFLRNGMKVAIVDVDREAGLECENLFGKKNFKFIYCDVRKEKDVSKAVALADKFLLGLDVLVNNAGGGGFGKKVDELTLDEWNNVISLNLGACFLMVKYSLKLFDNRGIIINISSTRAIQSEKNTEAYSAAKGGILAFTHALAVSLSPKIRVNCISPGWIRTDGWKKKSAEAKVKFSPEDNLQHLVGRIGVPEDIAGMAAFLASDEAGFISGQNFVVDGGMTKKMIYV